MKKNKAKGKKKHRIRKLLVLSVGGAAAYTYYQVMKPPACPCTCSPEERVQLKDEENMGGVGLVMENMISKYVDDPAKASILDRMDLVIAIEPIEEPQSAITMSFKCGRVVIEPGIASGYDIMLTCDYDVLMALPAMGVGLQTVKYLMTPEGQEVMKKMLSGQIKIKGKVSHLPEMLKLSMFLAVPEEE